MYGKWHGGYGYRRGGFFWPGLLLLGLFILMFGRFLLPLLIVLFFVAPFIFRSKGGCWGRYSDWHGDKRKWYGDDYDADEKPKRGGEVIEIV